MDGFDGRVRRVASMKHSKRRQLLSWLGLLEGDVRVEHSTDHADVQTDEVQRSEHVVSTDPHSDVRDHDVLRVDTERLAVV